jgi:hypothetical protein
VAVLSRRHSVVCVMPRKYLFQPGRKLLPAADETSSPPRHASFVADH